MMSKIIFRIRSKLRSRDQNTHNSNYTKYRIDRKQQLAVSLFYLRLRSNRMLVRLLGYRFYWLFLYRRDSIQLVQLCTYTFTPCYMHTNITLLYEAKAWLTAVYCVWALFARLYVCIGSSPTQRCVRYTAIEFQWNVGKFVRMVLLDCLEMPPNDFCFRIKPRICSEKPSTKLSKRCELVFYSISLFLFSGWFLLQAFEIPKKTRFAQSKAKAYGITWTIWISKFHHRTTFLSMSSPNSYCELFVLNDRGILWHFFVCVLHD